MSNAQGDERANDEVSLELGRSEMKPWTVELALRLACGFPNLCVGANLNLPTISMLVLLLPRILGWGQRPERVGKVVSLVVSKLRYVLKPSALHFVFLRTSWRLSQVHDQLANVVDCVGCEKFTPRASRRKNLGDSAGL